MFNPKECDINKGTLESLKTEFQNLHDRICGRAEGYGDVASTTANKFTDIIASPMRDTATENQESWSSAMMACTVAIGSLSETIEAVEWYEEKIEDIRVRLQAVLSASSSGDNATAVAAIMAPYQTEANAAWDTLEEKCEDAGETLADGADPDNIRKLIEAGHISADIAFATTGDWDLFYFDPDDAEAMAEDLQEIVATNGAVALGALSGVGGHLSVLNELIQRSLNAQRNGGTLDDNEVEFLENLFGEFTDAEGNDDLLGFLNGLESSSGVNASIKEDINEALSGALLAVSDESIGGGYEKVPADVRNAAEGPIYVTTNGNDLLYSEWRDSFGTLSNLLAHAPGGLQGGMDLSAELTATISRTLHTETISFDINSLDEGDFTTLLDVSTRNADANYVLTTGEYPEHADGDYELGANNSGVSLESILGSFYGRSWADGGEAAAGFTDWIYDYATDPDSGAREDRMSTEAAFEIITALTSDPLDESLRNTGITSEGGNEDASFTELNSHIAGSMNNLYFAHIEDFSMEWTSLEEEGGEGATLLSSLHLDKNPLHQPGDYGMFLENGTKTDFLQFLLANDELAPNVLAVSHAHEMEHVRFAMTGGDDVRVDENGEPVINAAQVGEQAGNFSNIVNRALVNEIGERFETQSEARKEYTQKWMTAYEITNTIASEAAGGKKSGLGAVSDVIFELGKEPTKAAVENMAENEIVDERLEQNLSEENGDEENNDKDWLTFNDNELGHDVRLQAVNIAMDEGFITPDDVSGELAAPGGQDGTLAQRSAEWAGGGTSNRTELENITNGLEVGQEGGNGSVFNPLSGDAETTFNEYADAYKGSHSDPRVFLPDEMVKDY